MSVEFKSNPVLLLAIQEIDGISERAKNALINFGFNVVGDLLFCDRQILALKIPDFSNKGLKQLEDFLNSKGMCLGMLDATGVNRFGYSDVIKKEAHLREIYIQDLFNEGQIPLPAKKSQSRTFIEAVMGSESSVAMDQGIISESVVHEISKSPELQIIFNRAYRAVHKMIITEQHKLNASQTPGSPSEPSQG